VAVTNVNLDFVPKKLGKIEKVRFEGWKAYESKHLEQKTSPVLLALLKEIHDFLEVEYMEISRFTYTPSMLVFNCNSPKGRTRAVAYFHFKKGYIKMERGATHTLIHTIEDFNNEVKKVLLEGFNELSINQK
jgi:hypothetical protein